MKKTKFQQTAELRPERVQLRAKAFPTSELRPERVQLQARLDALSADPAWQVTDDGQSLVGAFARPAKSELADLICLLTDMAPRFGVTPRVSFSGERVLVTFTGTDGELSRRDVGFSTLVDDLFPALPASAPADPVGDEGDETGEPSGEPVDGPVVSEPTEPVGDVIATA